MVLIFTDHQRFAQCVNLYIRRFAQRKPPIFFEVHIIFASYCCPGINVDLKDNFSSFNLPCTWKYFSFRRLDRFKVGWFVGNSNQSIL